MILTTVTPLTTFHLLSAARNPNTLHLDPILLPPCPSPSPRRWRNMAGGYLHFLFEVCEMGLMLFCLLVGNTPLRCGAAVPSFRSKTCASSISTTWNFTLLMLFWFLIADGRNLALGLACRLELPSVINGQGPSGGGTGGRGWGNRRGGCEETGRALHSPDGGTESWQAGITIGFRFPGSFCCLISGASKSMSRRGGCECSSLVLFTLMYYIGSGSQNGR